MIRLVTPPLAQIPILSLGAAQPLVAYESTVGRTNDGRSTEASNAVAPSNLQSDVILRESPAAAVEAGHRLATSPGNKQASDLAVASQGVPTAWSFATVPLVFFTGSLIMTAAMWLVAFRQFLHVRRLLRSKTVVSDHATSVLQRTAACYQLRRLPRLIIVDAPLTPMLWAGERGGPAIILPRQLSESLVEEQLEQVIAHELAHWRRLDHWTNLMGLVIVSWLWWNPVAWLARREMLAAAEASCDAMAVECLGGSRKSYATTLLRVIDFIEQQRPQRHALGTMFGSSQSVRMRFQSICDVRVRASVSRSGRVLLIAGAATLAVLPVLSQEATPPVQASFSEKDAEVARDLVAVLGEDHSRLWGLPPELVIDAERKLIYLPETNGSVSVFDANSLCRTKSLPLHKERCLDVAITDNGNKLVTIAMDGTARLWDISSDSPTQLDMMTMSAEPSWLKMSATKNGDRVAFRSDNEISLVDIRDGRFVIRLRLSKDNTFINADVPHEFALSPDGRRLAICEILKASTHVTRGNISYGYRDAILVLWDLEKDKPEPLCELNGKDISHLEFSADSGRIYATDPYFLPERTIHEWLVRDDGQLIPESNEELVPELTFQVRLPFVTDGSLKAVANGAELTVTATEGTQTVSRGTLAVGEQMRTAAFLGNDIVLIARSLLQRWDWIDGKYQRRQLPSGHQSSVIGLLFNADNNNLVSASHDSLFEWNPPTLPDAGFTNGTKLPWRGVGKIFPWAAQKGFVLKQRLDPRVFTNQTITGIARHPSGQLVERFSLEIVGDDESDTVWCLAMHPTEPILATGHHGHKIFLWDISGDQPVLLTTWVAHRGHVCDVAFSPDGNRIASAGWDKLTILWDITPDEARDGAKPLGTTIGTHADIVRAVAWSHDGAQLASGGEDGQILLWDLVDGEPGEPRSLMNSEDGVPVRNTLGPQVTVNSLEFSKSGAILLSADGSGRVCMWSVADGSRIKKWQFPGWIWQARFSPEESTIATANNDGTVYILQSPAVEKASRQ